MLFGQLLFYPDVLCQVAIGLFDAYVLILLLKSLHERLSHDPHKGTVPEGRGSFWKIPFCPLFRCKRMVFLMACLAEGDQIFWAVPACLSGFQMVDVQDGIFRLSMAVLALVSVPEEHVLPDIPESQLRTFLIFLSGDIGVPELLRVERSCLHDDLCHRKNPAYCIYAVDVALDLMLHCRSKPSFFAPSVVEPWRSVPGLSVSSGPSGRSSCRDVFCDIISEFHVGAVQFFGFCGCGKTDML